MLGLEFTQTTYDLLETGECVCVCGGGVGAEGDRMPVNSSSQALLLAKTGKVDCHHRNHSYQGGGMDLYIGPRVVGTSPVPAIQLVCFATLLFQQLWGTPSDTKTAQGTNC